MSATLYLPDGSRNADGSSYYTRHCASRDYRIGTILDVVSRSGELDRLEVRDRCGVAGRIDLPVREYAYLFPDGTHKQPRGGYRVIVRVEGRARAVKTTRKRTLRRASQD